MVSLPMPVPLILASASPRRRQLLARGRLRLRGRPLARRRARAGCLDPRDRLCRLAGLAEGFERGIGSRKTGLILGADTSCSVGGMILNKPVDRADAERMIRLQEGREIEVVTGLCLYRADRGEWVGAVEVTVCACRAFDGRGAARAPRFGALGREGGGLWGSGRRPVRDGRPGELVERRRPADGATGEPPGGIPPCLTSRARLG